MTLNITGCFFVTLNLVTTLFVKVFWDKVLVGKILTEKQYTILTGLLMRVSQANTRFVSSVLVLKYSLAPNTLNFVERLLNEVRPQILCI